MNDDNTIQLIVVESEFRGFEEVGILGDPQRSNVNPVFQMDEDCVEDLHLFNTVCITLL